MTTVYAYHEPPSFHPDPRFDNAVAELGGHLPYKVEEKFDNATYEDAIGHLQECRFEKQVYDELEGELRCLLN